MKEKLIIPVLLGNDSFPINCSNTHINFNKDYLTVDKLNKLIKSHLENKNVEDYEKELIFLGSSYFDLPIEKQLILNEVISKNLQEKNIDYVVISANLLDINYKNLKYIKKNNINAIELKTYNSNLDALLDFKTLKRKINFAINILKFLGFKISCEILVGNIESEDKNVIEISRFLASKKIDYVRVNNLYVTKGSKLLDFYDNGQYMPYTTQMLTDLILEIIHIFKKYNNKTQIRLGYFEFVNEDKYYIEQKSKIEDIGIKKEPIYEVKNKKVIQIGKINNISKNNVKFNFKDNIIVRPYEPNLKQIIENEMWYDAIAQKIKKLNSKVTSIQIEINPEDFKNVIGIDGNNYKKLTNVYELEIEFVENENIEQGSSNINILK